MSFDALTIVGMLAALLSGGFLVGVARANEAKGARASAPAPTCKDEVAG